MQKEYSSDFRDAQAACERERERERDSQAEDVANIELLTFSFLVNIWEALKSLFESFFCGRLKEMA